MSYPWQEELQHKNMTNQISYRGTPLLTTIQKYKGLTIFPKLRNNFYNRQLTKYSLIK